MDHVPEPPAVSEGLARQLITAEWKRNKPRAPGGAAKPMKLSKEAAHLVSEVLTAFIQKAHEMAAEEAECDAMANEAEIDPQHLELVAAQLFLDH